MLDGAALRLMLPSLVSFILLIDNYLCADVTPSAWHDFLLARFAILGSDVFTVSTVRLQLDIYDLSLRTRHTNIDGWTTLDNILDFGLIRVRIILPQMNPMGAESNGDTGCLTLNIFGGWLKPTGPRWIRHFWFAEKLLEYNGEPRMSRRMLSGCKVRRVLSRTLHIFA